MAKKKEWATPDLFRLLKAKYPAPKYAFIGEVPNATSVNKTRSADAIAMGCWESVGILMNGFEIKVSRSDWLKELKDLSKSYAFQRYCHRWWIVAVPGIVKQEEMPADWGLLLPHGEGLRVKKAAALRDPERPDFDFLAGLLRRIVEVNESESEIRKATVDGFNRGWREGLKHGDDKLERETANNNRAHTRLRERVSRFQQQSGINIEGWGNENIGNIVKLIQSLNQRTTLADDLERIIETASNVAKAVEELKTHVGILESTQSK